MATIRFYESCPGAEHLGPIPSGEGGRSHGVVIELVELHLPAHLARFVSLLNGVNRAIHLTRRTLPTPVLMPWRYYTYA